MVIYEEGLLYNHAITFSPGWNLKNLIDGGKRRIKTKTEHFAALPTELPQRGWDSNP